MPDAGEAVAVGWDWCDELQGGVMMAVMGCGMGSVMAVVSGPAGDHVGHG